MERHTADQLHVEVPHTQRTHTRLAHHGKGFGEQLIEFFALIQARAKLIGFGAQGVVIQRLHRFFKRTDAGDNFAHSFQLPVVTGAK